MRIAILDDDEDLRATMCDVIVMLANDKYQCLSIASYQELVERGDEALKTDLAIIDINLGENVPSGLDAETWLRANRYGGEIVFLTGHARSHPLVTRAVRERQIKILEKPLGVSTLVKLIMGTP
jgi:FixJ family two-component response regulator